MNLKTGKIRISKKVMCVILSLIIAFGTFVTITFGSSFFQKWFGVQSMLSAYAAEIVNTDGVVGVNEEAMRADDHTISLENQDGSNTVYIFTEPISFIDSNGDLKTKDITVENASNSLKKKGYEYTNGKNDFRINFSEDKDKGIQIAYNDISFSIIPKSEIAVEGKESVAEFLSENFEVFQYKNIYGNGTNLRYYPQLNGVKDEIVLNQNINKNTFSFELVTENCTAKLNDDGTVSLVDKSGMPVHTFDAPYAYDSLHKEGEENEHIINCKYSLTEHTSNSYLLSIYVDRGWLESSNTVYPVIIDPVTEHLSQNKDTYVRSSNANTNYGSAQSLCLGKTSSNGKARVFTHFSIPSEIHDYATINSAAQWERETSGGTATTNVCAYLVNNTWTEDALKWNNQPGIDPDVAPTPDKNLNSQSTDKPDYPLWYKFNITGIVQAIIGKNNDNKNNYGLVFKAKCEDNSYERWKTFASREYSSSSYRPYTVISYTNDTTAPIIDEIVKSPANWTNQNVRFTVTATDSGSGVKDYAFSITNGNYSYGSSRTSDYYSTNRIIYFAVRDYAGNVRTTTRGTYIDKLKPNTPAATVNPSGWTQNNVSITVQSDDAAETDTYGKSGVKYYSCTKTAGTYDWKEASTLNGAYTFTDKDNGIYYIYAKDRAGNISNAKTVTAYVDPEKPVVNSVDINTNANNNESTVHIIASDVTSGINAYSLNGGQDWTAVTSAKNIDISPITTVNTDSIDVRVRDLSGRVSDGKIVSLESPEFYSYDGKAGILNPNLDERTIEYRTGNDNWKDYSVPIDITETTTVYARYKANGQEQTYSSVSKEYNPIAEPEGVYTESETDLTITNNDLSFDVTRDYSSYNNEWRFSTETSAMLIHNGNIVKVNMPDNSNLYFVKTAENTFTDELNGYVLNETSDSYTFNIDGEAYSFSKSTGRLKTVAENGHSINFEYTDGALTGISATEGTVTHSYTVNESNGKLNYIITPLGEKLAYQYTNDGLVKVCYDKDTLQFGRTDDIIISEYTYSNGRIETTNGNTVHYDNDGHYVSLTTTWNETVESESESEPAEPEAPASNESETVELDFSSDYPVFYEGTETIHYDKSGYMLDGTAYITEKEYNSDSRLISVTETQTTNYGATNATVVHTENTAYTYYGNSDTIHTETITETESGNTTITAVTYDANSRVISESTDGNTTSYTYDVWGNVLTETNSSPADGGNIEVTETVYVYDELNRCIKETTTSGNETEVTLYAYNPLDDVIYEKVGTEVTRTLYDKYGRVIQEIEPQDYATANATDGIVDNNGYLSGNDTYSLTDIGHRYVYNPTTRLLTKETNRLDVVTDYTYHTDSSVVATETFDIYRYEYNTDGNLERIKIHNDDSNYVEYAQYVYDTDKNNTEIRYGNGQTVYYEYENGKEIVQKFKKNSTAQIVTQFEYSYTDGVLTSKTDYTTNRRTDYNENTISVYDISTNSDVLLYSYANTEEDTSTNTAATAQKNYAGNTLNVTYGENSNQYKLNNNDVFSVNNTYTYDLLSSTVINNPSNQAVVSKSYTYDNDNNVTGLTVNNTSISYVYDDDKIKEYHQGDNAVYYHYDSKGQLEREDITYSNYSRTITYTYDIRGNLTKKKEYPYTRNENPGTPLETNELEFEYEDELWLDEIVTTPTGTILYDENGNPVNLEDCTLEWTNGRQLKAVTNGNDVILEYTYDDNGIRTSKTYQGVTTYYCTENGIITSQYQLDSSGNKENEVIFVYDNGSLVSAYYDSAMYYYITNLMGDVISIIDESGNTVVDYCYDGWGNIVDKSVNTTLSTDFADVNPMHYRSYYYDEELGVYYLQSRYYKSDWCRFINSDLPTYADEKKDEINGMNLFSYCGNDAINYVDPTGFKKEKKKKKSKEDKVRELLNNFLVSNVKVFNTKQLGVVKLYLEKKNFYEKLYEATLISKSKTWKILAEQAKATFKKQFSRDIIFNNHVLRKEIKYHVLGYLYSRDYNVNCPKVFLIKAKLEYPNDKKKQKEYIKDHCKIIDISEMDVYNFEQEIVFGYFEGIRPNYKNSYKDPYYLSNIKQRNPGFTRSDWGDFKL